jgi:hypothetical protein
VSAFNREGGRGEGKRADGRSQKNSTRVEQERVNVFGDDEVYLA